MARVPLHPAYVQQLGREFAAQRRSFDEIYQQATQGGFAQAFQQQAAYYPYARPGLLYALTAAGIPAGDPVANQLAEMSFTQSMAEDPSFALPEGQQVQASVEKAPASQGEGVSGLLYDGMKSLARGTFLGLAAPFEEVGRFVTSATEAALDDEPGFINDFWSNLGKAAPSGLATAVGELYHRVQAGEVDLTDPSSLRENLWSGDPEFIGSGLLPGGQVRQVQEERKQNLQLNGQFLTPGRSVVELLDRGEWVERGSTTYGWLSGAADFALNVFADPVNYIPVAGQAAKGAKIRRATQALAADPVDLVRQVPDGADFGKGWRELLMRTPVRTVDGDGAVWEFSSGSRDANWLMASLTQESSPTRINRAFGGNLPRSVAVQLADTTDPQDIAAVLRQSVIDDLDVAGIPSLSRGQRSAVRDNATTPPAMAKPVLRRASDKFTWATIVPDHETRVLGTANDTEIAATADRFINHYRASESVFANSRSTQNFDEATEYADRIMRIQPGPEAQSELGNVLKEAMEGFVARTGVESPAVQQMISRDATYAAESRSYLASMAAARQARVGQRYRIILPDGTVKKGRVGTGESSLPVVIGGEVQALADPIRLNELVQNYTVLPDWRDIRRATSVLSEMDLFKGVYGINDAARSFTKGLWMPAILLRPAITTRILLDGQIRTSFDGVPGIFNHPIEYFANMISRKGVPRYDRTIMDEDFAQVDSFKEAMESFSFSGFTGDGGHVIPAYLSTDYAVNVERSADPRSWLDSITRHLIRLANSPTTRRIASDGVDRTADWMMDGGGRHILDTMNRQVWDGAVQTREDLLTVLRTDMADLEFITGTNPQLMHELAEGRVAGTRVARDWDPDTGLVRESMNPDPDYFEQVRKGLSDNQRWLDSFPPSLMGSKSVSGGLMGSWDKFKMNVSEAQNWLFDTLMTKPENATTRSPMYRKTYYRTIRDLMDRLTREEALEVVKRARTFGNVAGPDTKVYRSFVRAGRRELDEMEAIARKLPSGGKPNMDRIAALDRVAGQQAAQEALDLLYDLGKRRLWEDAFSVGAPFIAVWADTLKTYAHPTKGILTTNPRMLNRFAQGLQGARSADPDGDGRTFIYQDQNGEEQFVIPDWAMGVAMGAVAGVAGGAAGALAGSTAAAVGRAGLSEGAEAGITSAVGGASARIAQQVGQRGAGLAGQQLASRALPSTGGELLRRGGAVAGGAAGMVAADRQFDKARDLGGVADIEFTGRPAGLNVAASTILPGAGPVVQIPLSFLVERTPSLDWVWDKIFPFGRPNVEGGVAESLFPAYMQRFATMIRNDPDSVRLFGNVVADVSSALLSSGDYANNNGVLTEEAQGELLRDATERAKAIFIVRGLAQSTLPTGPEIEFTADTQFGELSFQALAQEYRDIREQFGGDVATGEFISRYGVDLLGVTLAKTRTVRARSFNPEGADWERQNGDLVQSYGNTIEFFAPDDGTDDFDFNAYNRALDRGDLESMTPEDRLRILNNIVASGYIRSQRALMGDEASKPFGRVYLRELRARLTEQYPGYGAVDNLPSAINTEAAIGELRRAVSDEDPRIADLPVTSAIREYLGLREQATQAALAINGSTFQSSLNDEIVELRDALRREAARIMLDTPEFADVWLRVFERELADDVGREEDPQAEPFDRWQGPAPLLAVASR